MNQSDNIHRLFDGELSDEEKTILAEAMAADPSLVEDFNSIESMAALHLESIPEPKDDIFIEREFLEIQKRIQSSIDISTAPEFVGHVTPEPASEPEKTTSNVIRFPGANWLKSAMAIAAALAITATGVWFWNQDNAVSTTSPNAPTVAFVETDIDGASSMIYMDEQSGWTFVWVDEPIDDTNEVAG